MLVELKENKDVIFKLSTKNLKEFLLLLIGFIKKLHALKGEVLVHFFSGEAPDPFPNVIYLKNKDHLDNKVSPQEKTFNVITHRTTSKGLLIQLENYSTRTEVNELLGQQIYIKKYHLHSKKGENLFLSEIQNFNVFLHTENKQNELLGEIHHFLSHSHQDLLVVKNSKGKEFEIPFIQEFIKSVDYTNQSIFVSLPTNLQEINE